MNKYRLTVNRAVLEIAFLFLLLLNILRIYQITNRLFLSLMAILFLAFVFFSKKRLPILFILVIIVLFQILFNLVQARIQEPYNINVHDGAIITEQAYKALISGQNPYSISYEEVFIKGKNYLNNIKHHEEIHYTYSPLMFLASSPIFFITQNLSILDFRVVSLLLFLASGLIGVLMIQEKVLFLILFLLNPIFLHSLFFGANEAVLLFFFMLLLYFLFKRNISAATIMLGFAFSVKLLILPLVPLYFLYMEKKSRFAQFALFLAVILLVYGPFMLWNFQDLINDLLIYHIQGGELGRPIAGYIGIPQLLLSLGVIQASTSFPFALLTIPAGLILLFGIRMFVKRRLSLQNLCTTFVILFLGVFSFSRIIQTDYLTFLSQVLLLSAFLDQTKYVE